VVIFLSAVSQDAVFFGFKIVGGRFYFGLESSDCFDSGFLSAVLGIILEWYDPKGCERIV
jgi:hypothetical protein